MESLDNNINLINLPPEVIVNIVTKLDLPGLRNLMLTCKFFRNFILSDNSVWRAISKHKLLIQNNSANRKHATLSCYNLSRVSQNWCKGIYRNKVVIYYDMSYMPWINYHNSEALLLSVGTQLKCFTTDKASVPVNCQVWMLEVPSIKRYDIRTNDISRFVIKNGLLVCGNRDGCVSVYKVNNVKRQPQLVNHIRDCHKSGQLEVTAVELINKDESQYVVSAADTDPKLHFWNALPRVIDDARITSHIERIIDVPDCVGVRCLASNVNEDKLALGLNGNCKPLLVDITTGQILMSTNAVINAKEAVRDIRWHNPNTVLYVTYSGMLQMIDIRSNRMVYYARDPFMSTLYCTKSDGYNAIVTGSSEYSRCVLYDARNYAQHVQMYFTQKLASPVYCLDFDTTKLIATADRSIAVLNFNINTANVQARDYSDSFEF